MMDLNTLYHRTVETWVDRVNAVGPEHWDCATPCREWRVRDLVNHVTGEDLWTSPLMRGSTLEEVGDRFDGDVLGDDPIRAALGAAMEATSAVAELLPADGTVHLSYGEERAEEYVRQLAADHLVHAWDLAVATSGDARLDPHLVAEVGPGSPSGKGSIERRGSSGPPARRRRCAVTAAGWVRPRLRTGGPTTPASPTSPRRSGAATWTPSWR